MLYERGLYKGFGFQVTLFGKIIQQVNDKLYKTFLDEGTDDGKSELQYKDQMKEVKAFLHFENFMI